MTETNRKLKATESGFTLIAFLVFMALVAMVLAATLKISANNARTIFATKVRSERYYQCESSIHAVLSWVRNNSQNLVTAFRAADFYNNFDRTSPSIGANEGGPVQVPTKLKMKGTNSSVVLSTDPDLATSVFPISTNLQTGASFDPVAQFQSAELGEALVRLTLVDAVPLDPTKDAPPLATPDTDFYPIYRVDAFTETDRGAHVYGYIVGNLYYIDIIGFYGRDYVDGWQDCVSATFTGSNPGPSNAKCPVGSNGTISIANNARIYGSARTNGSIVPTNRVCGDYPSCTTQGNTCQGPSCNVPGLPVFQSWDYYCPPGSSHGDYTVGDNQNRILVTAGCYDTVTINNRGSLTLQTVGTPYYFRTLTIVGGNAKTQLRISPVPNTGTVELYVETITGNNINGNQTVNPAFRPSQFRIYYLGIPDLMLNGNSSMAFALVAPYSNVTVSGNANFSGGIIAKGLRFNGNADIIYDESLGGTTLSDLTARLRGLEEGYK